MTTIIIIPVLSIDCFKCVSINRDYLPCEDPFHNNYTVDVFQSPCMAGRKGRDGVFPATSCVKINGVVDTSRDVSRPAMMRMPAIRPITLILYLSVSIYCCLLLFISSNLTYKFSY
ncbi:hypothetical protein NQ314_011615, partial [Rhamnusium bicolor]